MEMDVNCLFYHDYDEPGSRCVVNDQDWYDWRLAFTEDQPTFICLLGEPITWTQIRAETDPWGPNECTEWLYNNITIDPEVLKQSAVLKTLYEVSEDDSLIIKQRKHQHDWYRT